MLFPFHIIILDILKENNTRRLEYLDLVIPYERKNIVKNGFTWNCNFQNKNYHHLWHSADGHQLNTIIDLLINLSENIYQGHLKILKSFPINKSEFSKDLKIIRENLDFIKDEVSKIKFISKKEIIEISENILLKPKKIESETKSKVEQVLKTYKEETD